MWSLVHRRGHRRPWQHQRRRLLVQVTRGENPATNSVAHATLTPLQADAAAGAYARTMAAYIQHGFQGLDHP